MEFLILRSSIKGPSSVLPNTECLVHKLQINFFLTSNCRGFPRETEVMLLIDLPPTTAELSVSRPL